MEWIVQPVKLKVKELDGDQKKNSLMHQERLSPLFYINQSII
jgi:hypothetical protein